jgi:hypothetical protein
MLLAGLRGLSIKSIQFYHYQGGWQSFFEGSHLNAFLQTKAGPFIRSFVRMAFLPDAKI